MGDLSKNFDRKEFACKCGCGYDTPKLLFVNRLQSAKNYAEKLAGRKVPFVINSGCRCPEYNKKVKGKSKSTHLTGEGSDISTIASRDRFYILCGLVKVGFKRFAVARTFIHADIANDDDHAIDVMWTY